MHKELIPYGTAWSWQKSIVKHRKALIEQNEDCSDSLIVLQHQPVYTLGTGSSEEYLNFNIKEAPYDVYRTERGGEVTYHGPGQVFYAFVSTFSAFEIYQLGSGILVLQLQLLIINLNYFV